MAETVRVATLQESFTAGAVADNLDRMERAISEAMTEDPGLQLILLPELAVSGFVLGETLRQAAQPMTGAHWQRMAALARSHQVHLAYGYAELGADGSLYDSLLLLDDSGAILANYRKIQLTRLERDHFAPGDTVVPVSTRLGRIGLLICWDLAFPELARRLARDGCQLLLAPCAWEFPYQQALRRFAIARAIDNGCFLALANQIGSSGQLSFCGHSVVLGPVGDALMELDQQPGRASAVIDYRQQAALRDEFYSMLDELRPELY